MSNLKQNQLDLEQALWDKGFKEESCQSVRTKSVQEFIADVEVKIQELQKVILIAKNYTEEL